MNETSDFRYFHIRNRFSDNLGGFTIAVEENLNSVRYAVSYCSRRDHFCKADGRAIAVGKFKYHFWMDQPQSSPGYKDAGEITIHEGFKNPLHIKYHILLDILFSDETQKPFVKTLIGDELFYMAHPI